MGSETPKITVIEHGNKREAPAPQYLGFFDKFNQAEYFEAHDVLEELWLKNGVTHPDYGFFKGLIQLAGAFVHMRKHFDNTGHPVHSDRLKPAVSLLQLAFQNLSKYPPMYHFLKIDNALAICIEYHHKIVSENYQINPWSPTNVPRLSLENS